MAKYVKKPVEIQAFQITKENIQNPKEWPDWLLAAWNKDRGNECCVRRAEYFNSSNTKKLIISTLEGDLFVSENDWIIQGVSGEIYPCKPDIFELTYDLVEV